MYTSSYLEEEYLENSHSCFLNCSSHILGLRSRVHLIRFYVSYPTDHPAIIRYFYLKKLRCEFRDKSIYYKTK
nr:MAG TPA: hypothetical protein [Caudoviricetes sp.]